MPRRTLNAKGIAEAWLIAVVVAIALCVIGTLTYSRLQHKTVGTSGSTSAADPTEYDATIQTLQTISDATTEHFSSMPLNQNAPDLGPQYMKANVPDEWRAEYVPPLTATRYVPGYPFKIASEAEPTIEVITPEIIPYEDGLTRGPMPTTPLPALVQARDYIQKQLTQNGFSDTTPPKTPLDMPTSEDVLAFVKGDVTCGVTYAHLIYSLYVRCRSPEFDKYLAARAAPLIATYAAKQHVVQSSLVAMASTIKSKDPAAAHAVITGSETAGYDLAELAVEPANGGSSKPTLVLFYGKNGVWHYVTQHSDEYGFSCDDMKADPDARKALYDQVCYQYPNTGQVRLDSSRRALQ